MCKLSDKSGVPAGWKLTCHVATMKTNPMVPCSLFTAPNGRGFKTLAEVQEYIQSEPVVRRYSNNMKDAAQTNCHICGKTFKFTAMRSHTKKNHGLTIMDYRGKYGQLVPLEEIYHKCGLCGYELLLDSDNVMIHLKNSHKITHANYNAEFMITARGRPSRVEEGSHVPGVENETGSLDSEATMMPAIAGKENENAHVEPIKKRKLVRDTDTDGCSSKQPRISNENELTSSAPKRTFESEEAPQPKQTKKDAFPDKMFGDKDQGESLQSPSDDDEIEENALLELMLADNPLTKVDK